MSSSEAADFAKMDPLLIVNKAEGADDGFCKNKPLSLSGLASLLLLQLDTQPWPFCPLSTGQAETTNMWRAVTARKAQKTGLDPS